MELKPIQDALLQVYPQWDAFFRETEFIDSLEVDPTANDGQRIFYNSRRFQFYTAEHRAVLLGREVLHVLLQHNARRQGRNLDLWARATEAVTSELLRSDGFSLPADTQKVPENTPLSEVSWAGVSVRTSAVSTAVCWPEVSLVSISFCT